MTFKQSPVVFDEARHQYSLGEKRLLGITGLIHSVLGLGVYPEADDYVRDYIIPKAGSRGTAVHHAIETYDSIGVKQPLQTVNTKQGEGFVDMEWDVSDELENYIFNQQGFKPLANEHTVSDETKWASQIDNIWQREETGGIWLVDTKTNNIDLYPLCGYYNANYFSDGESALKEYLSWQLSIYAELFEAENPGLKVEGLACNWLRKDRSALWEIERKPSDLVKSLLTADYIFTDNGPIFFHADPSALGVGNFPAIKEDAVPIVPKDVVTYVTDLLHNVKDLETKLAEAKAGLRAAMVQHEVKKHDFGTFSATLSADTTATSFDSKRFKADHPELYNQYLTSTTRKGSLTIKLK